MAIKKNGFTFIEMLITLTIISIMAMAGASSYLSVQEKQKLINVTTNITSALQNAQTQAIATRPDGNGDPAAWGVLIPNENSSQESIYIVPIPSPDDFSIELDLLPAGVREIKIDTNVTIENHEINDPTKKIVPPSHDLVILFNKINGTVDSFQINPGNHKGNSTNKKSLNLILSSTKWSQTITLEPQGQIIVSTPRKK